MFSLTSMTILSDVQYVSKYRDTPGVSGYDTAMLVYRYFYKFKFVKFNNWSS